MKKSHLVVAAAVPLALLALFVWPTRYSYDHINSSGSVYPVRVNRFTGAAEVLDERGWRSADGSAPAPSKENRDVPPDTLSKLEVTVKLWPPASNSNNQMVGYYAYNGTEWTLKEIYADVTVQGDASAAPQTQRLRLTTVIDSAQRRNGDLEPREIPPYSKAGLEGPPRYVALGGNVSLKVVGAKGHK